ncbi:MAG: hypothetical protein JO308_06860, partial [Verrucomicrobia bacterium]|nr:hypothetical protein [Verrucomicrobiota bacterium]
MPGIAGVISEIGADACQRVVHSMIGRMQFETFYASGTHFVPEMGIYAGWVAPECSSAAKQIFTNPRKDIVLLFAGEFFPGSKDESNSCRNGNSDREGEGDWLIRAYEEQGDGFFEKLNGLFSGLLIDKRRKKAFLFNDRYGLERIYICEAKTGIYFASEAKALLRVLPELRAFDENGVAQFVTFGSTLNWQTLFRGVQLLPGGSVWSIDGGKLRKGSYFSHSTWESQVPLSEPEFESRFKETFKRVLPRYLDSGTGIGVSLTGGLDTRMITACLPSLKVKPLCYTFTGQQPRILDSRLAARIAAVCGMRHRNLGIEPDFFANFADLADKTVYITDGCFGVLGAHEVYFNRKARELAPVRLTGNFGSEVLRGMSTFKPIGLWAGLLSADLSRETNVLTSEINRSAGNPVAFAAFKEIPWNLFGSLSAGRSQVIFRTPYLDNEIVALAFRAPESLRSSS